MNTHRLFLTITSLIALGLLGCAAERSIESGESPSPMIRHEERTTAISTRLARVEDILAHGEELGLDAAQREEIEAHVRHTAPVIETAADVVRTRTDALSAMLDAPEVDLPRMIDAGRALANAEAALKTRHIELLLQIHALLTHEQRERLRHQLRSSGGAD